MTQSGSTVYTELLPCGVTIGLKNGLYIVGTNSSVNEDLLLVSENKNERPGATGHSQGVMDC